MLTTLTTDHRNNDSVSNNINVSSITQCYNDQIWQYIYAFIVLILDLPKRLPPHQNSLVAMNNPNLYMAAHNTLTQIGNNGTKSLCFAGLKHTTSSLFNVRPTVLSELLLKSLLLKLLRGYLNYKCTVFYDTLLD